MKFKKTGAEKSTITREVNDLTEKTGNVFKAVSILAVSYTHLTLPTKA